MTGRDDPMPEAPAAAPPPAASKRDMGFREFVAIVAALMAINALGIDIMLPALPTMAAAFGITDENSAQFIIAAYVFGFGAMQIVYGPLADRFGRRPVLFASLGLFVVTSLLVTLATSLATIVVARLLQGMGAAASRVLSVSIIRDRYAGRQMARVTSLVFIVFLAVPILAPSMGQAILLVGPWPWIFYLLALFGAVLIAWAALRLPETLDPRFRRTVHPREIAGAMREVLTNRVACGYTIASTLLFGSLMGFINSVQQIFNETFRRPDIFTLVFAGSAAGMAVASLLNSRIVGRLGSRRVSQTALIGFIGFAIVHLGIAAAGLETVTSFAVLQTCTLFCFALAGSNFGAMAMDPMGHIAGTASAVQGTLSTIGGALIGLVIGQAFDGTTVPVAIGYAVCGCASLAIVAWVERGKLFRPQHAALR